MTLLSGVRQHRAARIGLCLWAVLLLCLQGVLAGTATAGTLDRAALQALLPRRAAPMAPSPAGRIAQRQRRAIESGQQPVQQAADPPRAPAGQAVG